MDVQFSTDKKLATAQNHQTLQCRTSMKSIIVSIEYKQYCRDTFGCFQKISRKQRLLVEALCVS